MCSITFLDIFSTANSYINNFIYFIDINLFKVIFHDSLSTKKCKIYINNDNTAKAHKFKTIETLNDDQLRLRQIIDQIGTLIHRASKVTVKYLDIRF